MRNPIKIIIIVAAVILLLLVFVFMKYVLLWPVVYKNNNNFDKATNEGIKTLLLKSMKANHSILGIKDEKALYTNKFYLEYIQLDKTRKEKSIMVVVNSNFMNSLEKTGKEEYKAEIQLEWPDNWHYYFRAR